MIKTIRTNAEHPDFLALVKSLDQELAVRDGEDHAFYNQFNKLDKIKHAMVAYVDEQPMGCGAIKAFDERTMEVKRMFTANAGRGQGVASKVLSELEKWAAELSHERCVLETGINQPEAIRLYGKCGYQRIANYGQYIGVDGSFCFEKMLKSK